MCRPARADHHGALKITHQPVEAALGSNKGALGDLTLPKPKSMNSTPMTISPGSRKLRIYVNMYITNAQCLR